MWADTKVCRKLVGSPFLIKTDPGYMYSTLLLAWGAYVHTMYSDGGDWMYISEHAHTTMAIKEQ